MRESNRENEVLVSIISVNYNGLQDTMEMIASLRQYVNCSCEVIVVDNGSVMDETNAIRACYPDVITVRSELNLGFAGGNNLGIAIAKGDYLFFLNNDTVVTEDPLPFLLQRFAASEKVGAVSPKIKFAWEGNPIQFAGYTELSGITLRNALIGYMMPDGSAFNKAALTPYIHGAAFMIRRDVLKAAGVMPELYFLYYEELDWSERIKDAGYELWYEPQALVFHKESRSTGMYSPLKTYYLTRNRLIYAVRNRKGCTRVLSIIYQLTVAFLKQNLVYFLKWKPALINASCKGVFNFFKKYKIW